MDYRKRKGRGGGKGREGKGRERKGREGKGGRERKEKKNPYPFYILTILMTQAQESTFFSSHCF